MDPNTTAAGAQHHVDATEAELLDMTLGQFIAHARMLGVRPSSLLPD